MLILRPLSSGPLARGRAGCRSNGVLMPVRRTQCIPHRLPSAADRVSSCARPERAQFQTPCCKLAGVADADCVPVWRQGARLCHQLNWRGAQVGAQVRRSGKSVHW